MSNHTLLLAATLALASAGAGPTTAPATRPASPEPRASAPLFPARPWERFQIVSDRNMFIRHGATTRTEPRASRFLPSYSETSAAAWVLTGVALQTDTRVAFLENTRTGSTIRAQAGQNVETGRIAEVGMDFITIDAGSGLRKITIGTQLDGNAPVAAGPTFLGNPVTTTTAPATQPTGEATADGTPTPATPAAGTPPTAPPASGEEAILQRLRAKRNQELGK